MTAVLTRSWVGACIVGELIGFLPPALTGAILVSLGASEPVLVVGLVIAGVAEGVALGHWQARILRDLLPALTGWTRATAAGAGVAWFAGMGGSSLLGAVGPWAMLLVGPCWVAGLIALPWFQRRRLDAAGLTHTRVWVQRSVIGWLVGVSIPVVALSVLPNGTPAMIHVVVAVAAAVAMGAVVGLVTAGALQRLLAVDVELGALAGATQRRAPGSGLLTIW